MHSPQCHCDPIYLFLPRSAKGLLSYESYKCPKQRHQTMWKFERVFERFSGHRPEIRLFRPWRHKGQDWAISSQPAKHELWKMWPFAHGNTTILWSFEISARQIEQLPSHPGRSGRPRGLSPGMNCKWNSRANFAGSFRSFSSSPLFKSQATLKRATKTCRRYSISNNQQLCCRILLQSEVCHKQMKVTIGHPKSNIIANGLKT